MHAGLNALQDQLAKLRKPPHCALPPAASDAQAAAQRQAPAPAELALGNLVDFEEHEADPGAAATQVSQRFVGPVQRELAMFSLAG